MTYEEWKEQNPSFFDKSLDDAYEHDGYYTSIEAAQFTTQNENIALDMEEDHPFIQKVIHDKSWIEARDAHVDCFIDDLYCDDPKWKGAYQYGLAFDKILKSFRKLKNLRNTSVLAKILTDNAAVRDQIWYLTIGDGGQSLDRVLDELTGAQQCFIREYPELILNVVGYFCNKVIFECLECSPERLVKSWNRYCKDKSWLNRLKEDLKYEMICQQNIVFEEAHRK